MSTPPPLPPPNPTISYEVTRGDIFFNWMTVMVRNRLLQFLVPVCLVVCTGLRFLRGADQQPIALSLLDAISYCAGLLIVIVVFQAIMGLITAFLMQHRGVVCRHTLEITEAGLVERTDFNVSLHLWPSICKIYSFGNYLFIYVGPNNAHQVPKRNLPRETLASFEVELRQRAKL